MPHLEALNFHSDGDPRSGCMRSHDQDLVLASTWAKMFKACVFDATFIMLPLSQCVFPIKVPHNSIP